MARYKNYFALCFHEWKAIFHLNGFMIWKTQLIVVTNSITGCSITQLTSHKLIKLTFYTIIHIVTQLYLFSFSYCGSYDTNIALIIET